jgi:hypothetical protein
MRLTNEESGARLAIWVFLREDNCGGVVTLDTVDPREVELDRVDWEDRSMSAGVSDDNVLGMPTYTRKEGGSVRQMYSKSRYRGC